MRRKSHFSVTTYRLVLPAHAAPAIRLVGVQLQAVTQRQIATQLTLYVYGWFRITIEYLAADHENSLAATALLVPYTDRLRCRPRQSLASVHSEVVFIDYQLLSPRNISLLMARQCRLSAPNTNKRSPLTSFAVPANHAQSPQPTIVKTEVPPPTARKLTLPSTIRAWTHRSYQAWHQLTFLAAVKHLGKQLLNWLRR